MGGGAQCCVTPPCTSGGDSGRCYQTGVCAALRGRSVPSRSGARGCEREPGAVQVRLSRVRWEWNCGVMGVEGGVVVVCQKSCESKRQNGSKIEKTRLERKENEP